MATNMTEMYGSALRDMQTWFERSGLKEMAPLLLEFHNAYAALSTPDMTPEEFVATLERYQKAANAYRVGTYNHIGRKNMDEVIKQMEGSAQMLLQEGQKRIRQEKVWAQIEAREKAEAEQAARDAEARAIREAEEKVQRDKEEVARIRRLLADNPDSGEANRIRQMLNLPPAPVP